MDDSVYNRLREAGWHRKLSREEEQELREWLAAHPARQSEWEAEAALNECLVSLPDVPLPSNFNARVLQAATQPAPKSRPRLAWKLSWHSFLPRVAVALVALAVGLSAYRYHESYQRGKLARRIMDVSDVAAISSPEVLQDFEAVRHLNQTPVADEELLALLQ